MNILQEIFTDHYEEIKYTLHPRPAEMENIDKMINCGDPSFGGAMYGCTHCGNLKFVPFRCHSRFCPTCGNKYSMERTTSMFFKLINARHRSIDKKLNLAISKEKRHIFQSFNRWRTAILSSFGYDPLICPHCNHQMVILEIYHDHHRVSLEELYKKAMSRSRRKRSSA